MFIIYLLYYFILSSPKLLPYACGYGTLPIQSILFDALIITILIFLPRMNFRRMVIVSFPYYLITLCELVYFLHFKNALNLGFIASIMEHGMVLPFSIIDFSIIISLLIFYVVALIVRPANIKHRVKPILVIVILLIINIILKSDSLQNGFPTFIKLIKAHPVISFGLKISKGIDEYKQFQIDSNARKNKIPKYLNRMSEENESLNVIILGGNQRKVDWSLYSSSSERDTTPRLDSLLNLSVFNEVISVTHGNLYDLKYSMYLNLSGKRTNIVDIFKDAGLYSYLISSRPQFGMNGLGGKFISSIDHSSFLSFDINDLVYDGMVINELESLLQQNTRKKTLIIINLIGVRETYKMRYPHEFGEFSDTNGEVVNAYNNLIQYSDFVVDKIISIIKRQNKSSFVLYLASAQVPRAFKEDFQMPMFVWQSDQFILENAEISKKIMKNKNRKISIVDLPQTLLRMSGIEVDKMSILDKHYDRKNRVVFDNDNNNIIKYHELPEKHK